MIKWFSLCAGIAMAATANAGELILHAPSLSNDGSYILRLEGKPTQTFEKLELYRSVDGSDFQLLATVPWFKAISQLVNQNGVYGYKIRGVTSEYATEFSEPVFVQVKSKSMQLQRKVDELDKQQQIPVATPELALGI